MKGTLAEVLEKYSTREYYLPMLKADIKVDEDVIYYNNFRISEKALDSALQLEAVLEVEKSVGNA
jgi:hypothetical protein